MDSRHSSPELRYREGAQDGEFDAPATIEGNVTGIDIDVVKIEGARGRVTLLYVDDLEVLGGPDRTLGLLVDAAEHRDRVSIALGHDRITYDNPAQLERFHAAAASEK